MPVQSIAFRISQRARECADDDGSAKLKTIGGKKQDEE
jgi:hypothetical protein